MPSKPRRPRPTVPLERRARSSPGTAFWLANGIDLRSARLLAAGKITTLADLSGRTEAEICELTGVGQKTIRQLEALLGHPLLHLPNEPPEAMYWKARGFKTPIAITLCQAGIRSLEDLARADRETLESLSLFNGREIRRCEAVLGRRVPARRDYWLALGVPPRLARMFVAAGLHSLEDVERLAREGTLLNGLLSSAAVRRCEELLGRKLPPTRAEIRALWLKRGYRRSFLADKLAVARLETEEDLAGKTDTELAQLGLTQSDIRLCRVRLARQNRGRPS